MSKPRSPLQQRFPPPPPPRLETSPETPPLVRKPKGQASSRSKAKKVSSFPISPPLNTITGNKIETWEEVQFNESMLSSPWETSSQFHDSALEISKHIQSVDTQSVNSFMDSIKEDSSIAMSTLINNLQQSKRGEEGHMESIVHILEKNKEVLQSADQILEIFKVAQQIAKNNASMISCENGYDDESFCSSSINVMEKKPGQVTISNRKSFQPPPPPPPTFKSSDQKKQKQKQEPGKVGSMKRGESFRSSMTSDATDSVLVMADRLAKTSMIDEPAIIQGPDDTDIEHARVTQKCNHEKPGGRVYKQIAVGTDLFDESGINRTEPSLDRRPKERESDDLMKQSHKERKKARSRSQQRRSSRKPSKPPQGNKERLIKKKKTQVSMVSNTTESTSQSTPSLLGQHINVSVRSSKSVGSNHSLRRDDDSKKSSRSQASRASSRKSSFSRKSRASRASSSYDDESLESGSVGDNPRPIFVLPAPSIDEISLCPSSLSCRSGRAPRHASESGASSCSGRSLPSRARQQFSDEKSSSWMNKIKSRLKKFKKKRPNNFDSRSNRI